MLKQVLNKKYRQSFCLYALTMIMHSSCDHIRRWQSKLSYQSKNEVQKSIEPFRSTHLTYQYYPFIGIYHNDKCVLHRVAILLTNIIRNDIYYPVKQYGPNSNTSRGEEMQLLGPQRYKFVLSYLEVVA